MITAYLTLLILYACCSMVIYSVLYSQAVVAAQFSASALYPKDPSLYLQSIVCTRLWPFPYMFPASNIQTPQENDSCQVFPSKNTPFVQRLVV